MAFEKVGFIECTVTWPGSPNFANYQRTEYSVYWDRETRNVQVGNELYFKADDAAGAMEKGRWYASACINPQ